MAAVSSQGCRGLGKVRWGEDQEPEREDRRACLTGAPRAALSVPCRYLSCVGISY